MPAVQHPVVEPASTCQPQPQRFIPSYASQAFKWAAQENYRHDESERQEQEAIERLQLEHAALQARHQAELQAQGQQLEIRPESFAAKDTEPEHRAQLSKRIEHDA
ncbi:hypothetical protein, partial [Comamonas thiooxydans]|uniref:hypothetical protein n=1 Tax=Comamonas thiooxydans TaxID=363952 RepID=UPI0010409C9F